MKTRILLLLLVLSTLFTSLCACTKADDKKVEPTLAPTEKPQPTAAPTQMPATPKPTASPVPVATLPAWYDPNVAIPTADIFNICFEGGKCVDKSASKLEIIEKGTTTVTDNATLGYQVAEFVGDSAFIARGISAYYEKMNDSFSHEFYFMISDDADTAKYSVISANMESGGFGLDFEPNKNGCATFGYSLRVGSQYQWAYMEEDADTDVFYHVVVTYDGVSLKLYIDGELAVDNDTCGGPISFPAAASQYYVIGADSGTGEAVADYFNGTIAFTRMYDKTLDKSEIYKLYLTASAKAEN